MSYRNVEESLVACACIDLHHCSPLQNTQIWYNVPTCTFIPTAWYHKPMNHCEVHFILKDRYCTTCMHNIYMSKYLSILSHCKTNTTATIIKVWSTMCFLQLFLTLWLSYFYFLYVYMELKYTHHLNFFLNFRKKNIILHKAKKSRKQKPKNRIYN